eukprot:Opistho-2@51556
MINTTAKDQSIAATTRRTSTAAQMQNKLKELRQRNTATTRSRDPRDAAVAGAHKSSFIPQGMESDPNISLIRCSAARLDPAASGSGGAMRQSSMRPHAKSEGR